MAEMKRMTADEVVSYLLEEDGVDFLIGAGRGGRSQDRAAPGRRHRRDA